MHTNLRDHLLEHRLIVLLAVLEWAAIAKLNNGGN